MVYCWCAVFTKHEKEMQISWYKYKCKMEAYYEVHTRPEWILLHSQYISSIIDVNLPNSGIMNSFCSAFFTNTNSSVAQLQ